MKRPSRASRTLLLKLALADPPAEKYEHLAGLDIGDYDRAAAAFVEHLLAAEPWREPA